MAADPIIEKVYSTLSNIKGIAALALGGSRAMGTADDTSDYDLIIFEAEKGLIDRKDMWAQLGALSSHPPSHTPEMMFGKIDIGGREVELFSRRIDAIAGEIAASRNGHFKRMLNPLHPSGFLSTTMISYATYCKPIWDPYGQLRQLMDSADPYPDVLRQKLTMTFRAEARLALIHAGKVRNLSDAGYLAGLYSAAVGGWTQALFAANRRYPLMDKARHDMIMALPQKPENFDARTSSLFRGMASGNLQGTMRDAMKLHGEVVAICEGRVEKPAPAPAAPAPA